jgi:hypothetical protein
LADGRCCFRVADRDGKTRQDACLPQTAVTDGCLTPHNAFSAAAEAQHNSWLSVRFWERVGCTAAACDIFSSRDKVPSARALARERVGIERPPSFKVHNLGYTLHQHNTHTQTLFHSLTSTHLFLEQPPELLGHLLIFGPFVRHGSCRRASCRAAITTRQPAAVHGRGGRSLKEQTHALFFIFWTRGLHTHELATRRVPVCTYELVRPATDAKLLSYPRTHTRKNILSETWRAPRLASPL